MTQPKIAVIGAGIIGRTLARRWTEAGYPVVFGVRTPDDASLADYANGIGAARDTINDAIASSDVVLVAINGAAMEHAVPAMAAALDHKIVIDATNNTGGTAMNSIALISEHAPDARAYRAFNSLGWENFADADYDGVNGDMLYAGPAGTGQDTVEKLIGATGLRPIRVGDATKVGLVDDFVKLWFALAFDQGLGRGVGFKILTRDIGS
jgi:predicted dinucleotide-binding enzyme